MTALRLYLILAWTALIAFTAFVIGRDGLNLLPVFFGDIAAGHWPGQFNADFLSFLALSALWTGWRNGWTVLGWLLAVAAFFLGGGFLMAYLLILLHRENGDMRRVLLGVRAA
ncbi:hypothetical protein [Novosphingobium sp. B 225]|uniref:hypothetical protein n=1 Tax=Novosphingobium sp. B 225 TaxID=1961849 RepID=UPI000B4AA374|nr:hypothetical protein [Novosphingobium sp. B 225]